MMLRHQVTCSASRLLGVFAAFSFLWSAPTIAADLQGRSAAANAPVTGSTVTLWAASADAPQQLAQTQALAAAQTASAQSQTGAPASPTKAVPPASAPAPAVAPEAERILSQLGAYIGSAPQFVFDADITFDHVLPSGQRLQFSATEEVVLQRPGRLYVEWNGDLGSRQFWYDGKSVTLFDPATPFYASSTAPPDIDAMLIQLVPKLDFAPPLADFLYSDPYKQVRGNIQYGFDLGQNMVGDRQCRTFAFVEKNIDWQIWVENGPQLTPCKLVITYKTQPSQPQFTAVFTSWNFTPRIAPSVFTPELPAGTQKIPFATVATAR
jgi:hypothetical protein